MVVRVIAERRAQPENDAISRILAKQDEVGRRSSPTTSSSTCCSSLSRADSRPPSTSSRCCSASSPITRHCGTGSAKIGPSIRRRSRRCCAGAAPIQALGRRATEDVGPRRSRSPRTPGSRVDGSANRDEREFRRARQATTSTGELPRHVAFSAGVHYCPGAPVSRAETRLLLEELLHRYRTSSVPAPPFRTPTRCRASRGRSRLAARWPSTSSRERPPHAAATQRRPGGRRFHPEEMLPHRRAPPRPSSPIGLPSAIVEDIAACDLGSRRMSPPEAELAERSVVSRVSIRRRSACSRRSASSASSPGSKGGDEVGDDRLRGACPDARLFSGWHARRIAT